MSPHVLRLTRPYHPLPRPERPRLVVIAAFLIGLYAVTFVLSAMMHGFERDVFTAVALSVGAAGAAAVAYGLIRGSRAAYAMALAYATVDVLINALDGYRLQAGALLLLILLGAPRSRAHFLKR